MQSREQLREYYEIELELARRLRTSKSREQRRHLYGEVYRERSERIGQHPLVREAADPVLRARSVAPQVKLLQPLLSPQAVVLEIGAGDGAVARAIAPLVEGAIAIDVTDVLALPSQGNYQFAVFDGFTIDLPDGSVDLVYSNDVVEHLHPDDLLEHAREVCRVLVPGGRYVCVTPNRLSGPHDVSRHFSDVPEGFHLREYTVAELSAQLRCAGFSRQQVVVSCGGRRLAPLVPAAMVGAVEAWISRVPLRARRPLARSLAALKVVATA